MVIHTAFAPEQNAQLAAAMDKARNQKLSLIELLQLAEHWGASGQSALAAELYKTWTAFNDQSPLLHLAFFNYSVVLKALGDTAGAINALKAALRAAPMMGQAHINLGRTYEDCGLGAVVKFDFGSEGVVVIDLADGGTAVVLANWLHVRGEDWRERVAAWVAPTGCDAWIAQREMQEPAE